MARKAKAEEHENIERWLVSYADFITLLFAFFVVMYSISSINEGKYRVLSDSLIAAFHSPNKTLMPIQVGKITKSPIKEKMKVKQSPFVIKIPEIPLPWTQDVKLKGAGPESYPSHRRMTEAVLQQVAKEGKIRLTPDQQVALSKELSDKKTAPGRGGGGAAGGPDSVAMKKIAADVQRALQTLIDKNLIKVRRSKFWVEVEIKDSVLFASGKASINPKAVPVIKDLSKILAPFPNVVRVEGFTDNVPIENDTYPSNWELSSARADSVVRLMVRHGISPPRLLAVGYGKYHPVADNATAAGRRKNRRVTLVVLAKGASELAIKADPAHNGIGKELRPAPAAAQDHEAKTGNGQRLTGAAPAPAHPAPGGTVARDGTNDEALVDTKPIRRFPPATLGKSFSAGTAPVIPPPIRLAPPINLPSPINLPMGSPMRSPLQLPKAVPEPQGRAGKRP